MGSINLNKHTKERSNLKAQTSLMLQNVFDANSISVLKQLKRYHSSWHQLTISQNWHDDSNQTEFIVLGLIPLPASSHSEKCNLERIPPGMLSSGLLQLQGESVVLVRDEDRWAVFLSSPRNTGQLGAARLPTGKERSRVFSS